MRKILFILTLVGVLVLPNTLVHAEHSNPNGLLCNNTYYGVQHINSPEVGHRQSSHAYLYGMCSVTYYLYHHNKICTSCYAVYGDKVYECTEIHGHCGDGTKYYHGQIFHD